MELCVSQEPWTEKDSAAVLEAAATFELIERVVDYIEPRTLWPGYAGATTVDVQSRCCYPCQQLCHEAGHGRGSILAARPVAGLDPLFCYLARLFQGPGWLWQCIEDIWTEERGSLL